MRIFNSIKLALNNLVLQKSRSFLTMLGIIIGVASVIAIMSIGASAQDLLLAQVRTLGSNLIGILPGASDENGPPISAFGVEITTLKQDDALALEKIPQIDSVAAYVKGRGTISFFNESKDYDYTGVSSSYLEVEDVKVAEGRFFKREEVDGLARVMVLGSKVKDYFF
ncbi:ABC transporter permease, partial [Patescibacteria group bacterium]|nr:ABC transporter permease [Patescibacteria group bacterium]